jgi:hypothetical protein
MIHSMKFNARQRSIAFSSRTISQLTHGTTTAYLGRTFMALRVRALMAFMVNSESVELWRPFAREVFQGEKVVGIFGFGGRGEASLIRGGTLSF